MIYEAQRAVRGLGVWGLGFRIYEAQRAVRGLGFGGLGSCMYRGLGSAFIQVHSRVRAPEFFPV